VAVAVKACGLEADLAASHLTDVLWCAARRAQLVP
jgi:hypothetical protein